MRQKQANGILKVYAGPMMSGKTTALIAELEEGLEEGRQMLVVKPAIDNRYSHEDIVSHDGTSLQKTTGHKVHRLGVGDFIAREELTNIDLLLIDEAQFFDKLCTDNVRRYLQLGIDVVAGAGEFPVADSRTGALGWHGASLVGPGRRVSQNSECPSAPVATRALTTGSNFQATPGSVRIH
jgi:hypothetical protein